jgi:hypothetical protein
MNNQSLRGYPRQQILTATDAAAWIRALFFDVETEGQPPAETELWPVLRSMEPGALNVAEQPLQPVADELENRLVD